MKNQTLKLTDFKNPNFAELEEKVMAYWDEVGAFEKSVAQRPLDKPYVFYDGPPFATGLPHYGHLLTSIAKDVVPRYWTMKGYRVERKWGWDCHGIPIENMIEKELGLRGGKKGIEEMGIDKFNAACRAAILRFDADWEKIIKRIGRWVDFKNSYKTMDKTFMESVWWAFKSLYDKKIAYQGKKVILYCPRCSSPLSNFEIAMDNSYKNLHGPSTVYKFVVKKAPFDFTPGKTFLLAWSTTPWNKIATPALAVSPALEYVQVKQDDEQYILAKDTVENILRANEVSREVTNEKKESSRLSASGGTSSNNRNYEILESFPGKMLDGVEFEQLYDFYPNREGKRAGVVVLDDYVTADEGTGVVTLAIYGEDDYRVMLRENIQLVEHVDEQGILRPEVTPWAGMFMLKVNPLVNDDLAKRGLIYSDEQRLHSVPVCYRCETRLYHAPVPAWFFDIQKLKPTLLSTNEKINWYPEHLKKGRFGKGLETAPDWNISRSRYWGTPMPVWKSQSSKIKSQNGEDKELFRIIGSLDELKQWAVDPKQVEKLTDIHREFLDDLEVWVDDAKTIKGKRIPEVFDCWVESGSMPYASLHYPFENEKKFEQILPAQYICEYISQTRAWFYTLHVMSTALFEKPAFENALTHGIILAEDGQKMSKSKKNYPDPMLLVSKYGVDSLRMYLMSSSIMKADNLNFSEKAVDEIRKKVFHIFWNVLAFYKLYEKPTNSFELPHTISHVLDRWLVSEVETLTHKVTKVMDQYDVVTASRLLMDFVDELSTWWLRLSRDRLRDESTSGEALAVFHYVLLRFIVLVAPFAPFFAELVYHNLHTQLESVHLELLPASQKKYVDEKLSAEMIVVKKVVEAAHAVRKKQKVKVRQPLSKLTATGFAEVLPELLELLKLEVNVKEVDWQAGESEMVELATHITPELKKEGEFRELVRSIQNLRKEAGCALDEKVDLELPKVLKSTLTENEVQLLSQKTLVGKITWGETLRLLTGS